MNRSSSIIIQAQSYQVTKKMQLSDFDYTLPKEFIAQYPLRERDNAKLLVLNRKDEAIAHRCFKDITDYLRKGDLLILNDTFVLPARLVGARASGGKVEVLLLGRKSGQTFNALIKPGRVKLKEKIIFNGGKLSCVVTAKNELAFNTQDINDIYAQGLMPLPVYIKRRPEDLDNLYYQTVYAKIAGSIAAPTAGLHFTEGLIDKIRACGIHIGYVTLHISYATFKPVKTQEITQHKMEQEYFNIPESTIELLKKARAQNDRIIAVGTTACRALETYAYQGRQEGLTDLFIYPGYEFKMADCLLTNFHLPRTTLFMLVCAFAGEKAVKKSYQDAILHKYRFYSYGDAMLII